MQELLEKGTFILTEDNGETYEYNTLFTFYNSKYNKHYVIYNNEENIHASSYNPNDTELNLHPIEDNEELNMVNEQITQTIGEYTTNTEGK